jgi:arabinofuranosyltransferase
MIEVSAGPAPRAGAAARRPWPAGAATALGSAAVICVYAVLAWDRRWLADDGLIVVRSVREILAGHGPVYSAFERAEPTTSALWMWLLAGCGWITGGDVAGLAVALGGGLAVGGLALALDASRRFHRAAGHAGGLAPAGAWVVIGTFPFWDFATSGLETGLVFAWLAGIWWLLVTLRPDSGRRRRIGFAIVVGLGPLVRPELAIATAAFLAAGWAIVRPPWPRALALAGCALAAPLAYEVFRAGYYGTLVPLPALAKSASHAEWSRGYGYLVRFVAPHLLYVPAGVLAGVVVANRRALVPPGRVGFAAPVITAVLLAGFVVRVGGDFMHARLLLPPVFLAVAPVLVVPRVRWAAPAAAVLAAWGLFTGIWFYAGARHLYADERLDYVRYTRQRNPTTEADHIAVLPVAARVGDALAHGQRLVLSDAGEQFAMGGAHGAPVAVVVGRLGAGGAIAPLDGIVVDRLGLANPLGARITRTQAGRTGHEKLLPWPWILADLADPAAVPDPLRAATDAARHAMTCGELAELLAAVRAPMTAARFWANLTGAARRTGLVIPADPAEAERALCTP